MESGGKFTFTNSEKLCASTVCEVDRSKSNRSTEPRGALCCVTANSVSASHHSERLHFKFLLSGTKHTHKHVMYKMTCTVNIKYKPCGTGGSQNCGAHGRLLHILLPVYSSPPSLPVELRVCPDHLDGGVLGIFVLFCQNNSL